MVMRKQKVLEQEVIGKKEIGKPDGNGMVEKNLDTERKRGDEAEKMAKAWNGEKKLEVPDD